MRNPPPVTLLCLELFEYLPVVTARITVRTDKDPREKLLSSRGLLRQERANPRPVCRETRPAQPHVRFANDLICLAAEHFSIFTDLFPKPPGGLFTTSPRRHTRMKSGRTLVSVGMGSPRPSPRRWLRSKVTSAAVEKVVESEPLKREDALALRHIALTIALISFRKNPRNGGHRGCLPTIQLSVSLPKVFWGERFYAACHQAPPMM
ncbi:hypothetical protein F4861DRAFT_8723 [Xylaria intraflava]|nr:hypothetical protein F4861DRAFT_8723 [Xylaria intraflava]